MKRIAGMILVVAMVASLGIVSVFAADTREDEMPATCIAEITESGEVIYYVEDEPKENDEATAPATWVADVDEDEEDSPIITRASDLILDENLSDVETSRGSGSTSFRISRSQPYFYGRRQEEAFPPAEIFWMPFDGYPPPFPWRICGKAWFRLSRMRGRSSKQRDIWPTCP